MPMNTTTTHHRLAIVFLNGVSGTTVVLAFKGGPSTSLRFAQEDTLEHVRMFS